MSLGRLQLTSESSAPSAHRRLLLPVSGTPAYESGLVRRGLTTLLRCYSPPVPTEPQNVLRLNDVTVRYGANTALADISVTLPGAELIAILGPNGAGKSTFLRAILGWHRLAAGSIELGGLPPKSALRRIAYLPQRQAIDWDFPITVRGVVEQGRYPALKLFRRLSRADDVAVDAALEELGLAALAHRPIHQLSGGQQQRVFLARAVAQGADYFLLDEPFAGLDLFATEELCRTLASWKMQGRTILAAVHDLDLARENFSQAVLLNRSLVAAGPIGNVLSQVYIDRAFRPPSAHAGTLAPRVYNSPKS